MDFELKSYLKDLGPRAPMGAGISELSAEDKFRARLAVRGWTNPKDLLGELDKGELSELLNSQASNVLTASQSRPGQWFLSNDVRVRTLAEWPRDELRQLVQFEVERQEELLADDAENHTTFLYDEAEDPILRAFDIWLNRPQQTWRELQTPVLTALKHIEDWTGEGLRSEISPTMIETELSARRINDDLARLTQFDLVGRGHEAAVESLFNFSTLDPENAEKPRSLETAEAEIRAVYMFGAGGSGKSTVLAHLQQRFNDHVERVSVGRAGEKTVSGAIVRIDFDEPNIDPQRLSTLNLALFEQLSLTLPDLASGSSAIIEDLKGQVRMQRAQELAEVASLSENLESVIKSARSSAESISSIETADSASVLYNRLGPANLNGPLVIVLDTAELILAQSDSQAAGIIRWLDFLQNDAGAFDIRLIIAGRDPPPSRHSSEAGPALRNLLERLEELGVQREADIELGHLEEPESAQLLRNVGLSDEPVIRGAARAVPGNPLLLRITATALQEGDKHLRGEILRAHASGEIDRSSARAYLMQRIVAHVTDPVARPYVLGAMVSPVLNLDLLRHVIVPAVSRERERQGLPAESELILEKLCERVFEALRATHWLCRPSVDHTTLIFERNIRQFVLNLVQKVHHDGVLLRDIRQSAVIYHKRKRGAMHRAMAIYHLSMLGMHLNLPRDREPLKRWLREVQFELPAGLLSWLEPPEEMVDEKLRYVSDPPAVTSFDRYSDEEWRLYLEGSGSAEGEGMRLVKHDQAREALNMYGGRPTREDGLPPAFVVRALCDLGHFENSLLNLNEKLEEGWYTWVNRKRLSPNDLSEIYWLTRFALIRDQGMLREQHIDLLRAISRKARGPGLTRFPSLIAVAEAFQDFAIMDERMRRLALKSGNEVRVNLGSSFELIEGSFSFELKQIAVVQSDWSDRLENTLAYFSEEMLDRVQITQKLINDMQHIPLAEVNQRLEKLPFELALPLEKLDWDARALLFRSSTYEFYAPLREAFLDGSVATDMYESLFQEVVNALTIVPREIDIQTLRQRLKRNPRAWISGLISFADQARVLPVVVDLLERSTSNAQTLRLCASFRAWDEALCRGGNSSWTQ